MITIQQSIISLILFLIDLPTSKCGAVQCGLPSQLGRLVKQRWTHSIPFLFVLAHFFCKYKPTSLLLLLLRDKFSSIFFCFFASSFTLLNYYLPEHYTAHLYLPSFSTFNTQQMRHGAAVTIQYITALLLQAHM